MNSQLGKTSWRLLGQVPLLLLTAGCASYWVRFDKHETFFRERPPQFDKTGEELEVGRIPCSGGLHIVREHGLYWWPGGFYRDEDDYGIYFKKSDESPRDFYFKMGRCYEWPTIAEARGEVVVVDHTVSIDVEYRDTKGKWRKPPINGTHKIDWALPDDRAAQAKAPAEALHQ